MSAPELRSLLEARLKSEGPEFHPKDVERIQQDAYLQRWLSQSDNDVKLALDMLWDTLVWRREMKASDLNESNIRMEYIKEGGFFPHGRDNDGRLLLIFKCRLHVKGQKDFEELKKCIVYWFDRIERQENGKPISVFFDMEGCGLSNMDMEFTKYLINLLKLYYPAMLNYIIIFEMPWVLSAAFKIIKQLLPAKAVSRMKFLNKATLKEAVPPEEALTCWGGNNDYMFVFVPEGVASPENTPKKVTFAEQGDGQHSPGEMLRLNPNDTIVFKTENDEISGQFTITNMDESDISFKIRTTSPEKFRVRPSSGTLSKGATQNVVIVVQPGFHLRAVTKDRFLVMCVQIPKTTLSPAEIAEVWQKSSGSKVDEYRLKCQFPEKEMARNGIILEGIRDDKQSSLASTIDSLQASYDGLNAQVKSLKLYQMATLSLTFVAVILGMLLYKNSSHENMYCDRI